VNLTHKDFQHDLKDLLLRCVDANVTSLILTGTSLKSSHKCINMTKQVHAGLTLQATVGQHPHDAKNYEEAAFERLAESAAVRIIGEWCVFVVFENVVNWS
jgi:TatD DNase family protein